MSKKGKEAPPEMHNADSLIAREEAAKLGRVMPELKTDATTEESPKADLQESQNTNHRPETDLEQKEVKEEESEESQKIQEESSQNEDEDSQEDTPANEEEPVDDYGNKVAKKRLYTDEEVNQIIRDRLKNRLKQEQQQPTQPSQQQAQDLGQDNADQADGWENQLKGFIENTLSELAQKQQVQAQQAKEQQSQAEFEIKFTQGMGKYADFVNVVQGKPITDSMMLATRSMQDPAAFIYAACKTQADEVARIANLQDPVQQIAEVARLEERMKKLKAVTKAPKPATKVSGDTTSPAPNLGIDTRIEQYAKQKIMRFK